MSKAKINSNKANKPQKWLQMDELHIRQNRKMLQYQDIYALHCSLGKWIFYYFLCFKPFFYSLLSHRTSLFLSSLSLAAVSLSLASSSASSGFDIFCNISVKVFKFSMIVYNIYVKVCKFAGFFLLKLLGSVNEVEVGFFLGVSVWFHLSRK